MRKLISAFFAAALYYINDFPGALSPSEGRQPLVQGAASPPARLDAVMDELQAEHVQTRKWSLTWSTPDVPGRCAERARTLQGRRRRLRSHAEQSHAQGRGTAPLRHRHISTARTGEKSPPRSTPTTIRCWATVPARNLESFTFGSSFRCPARCGRPSGMRRPDGLRGLAGLMADQAFDQTTSSGPIPCKV